MAEDIILNDDLTTTHTQPKNKTISLKYKILIAFIFGLGYFLYRLFYKKYIGNACNIDKYH